jgi:hypothetical protein
VKSLEIINDADEDDEKDDRDITSVDDENVLISQDTLEEFSPEIKKGLRNNQEAKVILESASELRKIKYD